MIGLGTIINALGIILGGISGLFFGKFMKERHQNTLMMASGICVIFIGMAGALSGMISIEGGKLVSGKSMLITISLAIGAVIGEIINIEDKFEAFGEWLKAKTGNSKDSRFVDAFVTASLTVCIGAMAIVGSITDGITGDYSILALKAVLDFIIIMVMTCSMGKGCVFSAIPVFLFEGAMTLLATLVKPLFNDLSLEYISTVGSILIFCVGLNLVWGKKVRVANLLPSLIVAVICAYLPVSF